MIVEKKHKHFLANHNFFCGPLKKTILHILFSVLNMNEKYSPQTVVTSLILSHKTVVA